MFSGTLWLPRQPRPPAGTRACAFCTAVCGGGVAAKVRPAGPGQLGTLLLLQPLSPEAPARPAHSSAGVSALTHSTTSTNICVTLAMGRVPA